MKRLIVVLALILFVIPLVAGCGQKQEAQNKVPVIKPMGTAQENNEESDNEEPEEKQLKEKE